MTASCFNKRSKTDKAQFDKQYHKNLRKASESENFYFSLRVKFFLLNSHQGKKIRKEAGESKRWWNKNLKQQGIYVYVLILVHFVKFIAQIYIALFTIHVSFFRFFFVTSPIAQVAVSRTYT